MGSSLSFGQRELEDRALSNLSRATTGDPKLGVLPKHTANRKEDSQAGPSPAMLFSHFSPAQSVQVQVLFSRNKGVYWSNYFYNIQYTHLFFLPPIFLPFCPSSSLAV
eukprot:6250716-Amphidinium_carterae.1